MKLDLTTVVLLGFVGYLVLRPGPPEPAKGTDLADVAKLIAAVAALKKALGKAQTTIEALRTRVDGLHQTSPFGLPDGAVEGYDGADGW